MICVVIPYCQREPGIPCRALVSISLQRNCSMPSCVIAVDVASPALTATR